MTSNCTGFSKISAADLVCTRLATRPLHPWFGELFLAPRIRRERPLNLPLESPQPLSVSLDETLLANHTTRGREIATRHNMAPPPRGRFYVEKFLGLKHSVGVACIAFVALSGIELHVHAADIGEKHQY